MNQVSLLIMLFAALITPMLMARFKSLLTYPAVEILLVSSWPQFVKRGPHYRNFKPII